MVLAVLPVRWRRVSLVLATIGTIAVAAGVVSAQPGDHRAQPSTEQTAGHGEATEEAADGLLEAIARVVNFAVLAAVLVYLFRSPLVAHLAARRDAIRADLAEARRTQEAAARQLEAVEAQLRRLPQDIEALKARGLAEIAQEEQRLAEAAEAERRRILDRARREVELALRVARRELVEFAADRAVAAATARIRQALTPADQERLIARYLDQMRPSP